MDRRHIARPAFTLIELLVAIAIIAALIALLLPAVQQAREAARRTTCQNHMKQIGLAIHNYQETYTVLPSAYVDVADTSGWGWGAMLLPYVEQTPLFRNLGVSDTAFSGAPTLSSQQVIPVYICPSDTGPNVNSERGNHAKSNYAGVFGSVEIEDWDDVGNGIFYVNSSVRWRDVSDGTSNTLAVGERRYDHPSGTHRGAIWVGKYAASAFASNIWSCVHAPPHKINGTKEWAFSSAHSGGAYFLLCDGHVRFISEVIDGPTYENLADKGDGNVIGEF